jgi:tight adherence protein B
MNKDQIILLTIVLVVALSAGLLTWFLIQIGTDTLARYKSTFTARAKFQAQEFFLFIDPRQLFVANIAFMAMGGTVVWIFTGSLVLGLAAFASLALMPRYLYAWMRKKRLLKFEEQLPDALMMIAGGMRAGAGLTSAIQQLVAEAQPPISQEFSLLVREQRLGVTLEQALSNLNRRVPTQTTTLVVSAMRIATETGGGLAETLERTSHTIRSRLQMEGKIRALTAQGKLQMWVVGMLPLGLMAVLNTMEPEAMGLMWSTRIGWATLAAIAVFEFLGFYVIKKIITIDV